MAEYVEKEEQLSEEEKKYRQLRRKVIIAGRICVGALTIGIVGGVAYTLGKHKGSYACLEEIYNNFPEAREAIVKIDPAFFTMF